MFWRTTRPTPPSTSTARASNKRLHRWCTTLSLAAVTMLLAAQPLAAFIEARFPLDEVIKSSDTICLTKVERVDPAKPAMVLNVGDALKGKALYTRFAINLTGDKEKHTPQLLKRVAPDLPVIVCLKKQGKDKVMMLAYTNGTWFQAIGTIDGEQTRWAFTHCEIYLRRTFKGTTSELETTIRDVLAGKRKAPPYDAKEPAGFGPEVAAN